MSKTKEDKVIDGTNKSQLSSERFVQLDEIPDSTHYNYRFGESREELVISGKQEPDNLEVSRYDEKGVYLVGRFSKQR